MKTITTTPNEWNKLINRMSSTLQIAPKDVAKILKEGLIIGNSIDNPSRYAELEDQLSNIIYR